jgi:hypothetical protein
MLKLFAAAAGAGLIATGFGEVNITRRACFI